MGSVCTQDCLVFNGPTILPPLRKAWSIRDVLVQSSLLKSTLPYRTEATWAQQHAPHSGCWKPQDDSLTIYEDSRRVRSQLDCTAPCTRVFEFSPKCPDLQGPTQGWLPVSLWHPPRVAEKALSFWVTTQENHLSFLSRFLHLGDGADIIIPALSTL